ncbi:MAG: hypothetical protein AB1442_00920 [Nitrospirota bacterium]
MRFVALLSLIVMLSQCSVAYKETVPPLSNVKPENIANEIKRFEKITGGDADPSGRAEAHLQLAKLYSSYKNPKPDYRRALRELEEYLSLEPAKAKIYEMQNWLALLRELARMDEELQKARHTISELKDAVEKLKDIDIKMEEKKKQVK